MNTAIPRRRVLVQMLAALGVGVLPQSRALAIDPITALQAAAAVVGIVAGISGMVSDADLKNRMDEIQQKLDQVIANQGLILDEIKALKVYVDEALEVSWRNAYSRQLVGQRDRLDILLADYVSHRRRLSSNLRDEFTVLGGEATQTTVAIGQMDFWAFPSFATGVVTVLLCDLILGHKPARRAETRAVFLKYVETWLNSEGHKSITAQIAQAESEVALRRRRLEERGRTYVVKDETVRESEGGFDWCEVRTTQTLTVRGDFAAGYSGTVREEVKRGRCHHAPICFRRGLCLVSASSEEAQIESLVLRPDWVTANFNEPIEVPAVPGFSPSGYAIVDQFNRERIAIYEAMAALAKQKLLAREIENMRRVMAS